MIVQVPMRLVIRQSCGCQPTAVAPLTFTFATQQISSIDRSSLAEQIKRAMTETVLARTQRLSAEEVERLCQNVVAAFIVSLERSEAASFRQALEQALTHVELAEDDLHVWQAAFLTLKDGAAALLETIGQPAAHRHVEQMLRLAQIAVGERVRRQYRHHVANQRWITDRMDLLNARLLAALDEAQIFEILAEHLPHMGIEQIDVVFFEAKGSDAVAWSKLHSVLKKGLFSIEETLTHVEAALARNKHLGSATQRLVRKAMAAIHEHYTEPISLQKIAHSVGISKEYLARCFHQETGVTLVTYLNRYRIDQAKARLE
ncbi:MAG: AraC family transcriptional regulator, partial [Chloroflexota bacterium]|nr:AraC family transcriptional regulator [Chloroflexota bacterium]